MTELQVTNNKLKSNPNIIHRNGQEPRVFKDVKYLDCIECKKTFKFDTKKTIYWFNAHGWVICSGCINKFTKEGNEANDNGNKP